MAVPPRLKEQSDSEELQDKIIWEFRALDGKRTGKIKPADALLVFKSVLGSRFSLATWYTFTCDRGSSSADVTLDEITEFLVAQPPSGHPASLDDYLSTEQELRRRRAQRDFKRYTVMTAGKRGTAPDPSRGQYQLRGRRTELEQKAERRVTALDDQGLDAIQAWLDTTQDGDVKVDEKLWERVYLGAQTSSPQRNALEKAVFGGDPFGPSSKGTQINYA